jgi:D-alanine-D-alanine ligase
MRRLRIGLAHNLKRIDPARDDAEAEYDSPKTIGAIAEALRSHGHEVVLLEATRDLPRALLAARVDLVFNIAEGAAGRSREAHVPALCELLGVPYTGSDPAALCVTLDKALGKRVLRDAGIPTPEFFVAATGREPLPPGWRFPAFVKPNVEGTSKGIGPESVVDDERTLRRRCRDLLRRYRQPVLVEEFLSGREFTVGVLGYPRPRVLPPMEVVFLRDDGRRVYDYSLKQDWTGKIEYVCPARLAPALDRRMRRLARATFTTLGCRDVARIDIRMDARGAPHVLEVNPLPGLTPAFSDVVMIAEAAGIGYRDLIGRIVACGVRRLTPPPRSPAAPRSPSAPRTTGRPAAKAPSARG